MEGTAAGNEGTPERGTPPVARPRAYKFDRPPLTGFAAVTRRAGAKRRTPEAEPEGLTAAKGAYARTAADGRTIWLDAGSWSRVLAEMVTAGHGRDVEYPSEPGGAAWEASRNSVPEQFRALIAAKACGLLARRRPRRRVFKSPPICSNSLA